MSPVEEQLHAALDSLHTRDDFVRFVRLLVASHNEPGPPWENATLDAFLTALSAAAENLEISMTLPRMLLATSSLQRGRRLRDCSFRRGAHGGGSSARDDGESRR